MITKLKIIRQPKQVQGFVENLNGVPLEMILIPSGSFIMGASKDEKDSYSDERPQHLVTFANPFFMGRYPVTQAQWKAIASLPIIERELKLEPSRFKGDKRPVERVSWQDTIEFCARLSRYTGKNYRLPSEAEWEYACRSQKSEVRSQKLEDAIAEWNEKYSQPFNFGETISTDLANYNGTNEKRGAYGRGEKGIYRKETTDVDHFKVANAFGLSDMHGNVREWCLDPWHGNYEGAPADGSVWDEQNKNDNHYQNILDGINVLLKDTRTHVLRGGAWGFNPPFCRSAFRYGNNFVRAYDIIGFRVAVSFSRIP